jgi:hypothetical protein
VIFVVRIKNPVTKLVTPILKLNVFGNLILNESKQSLMVLLEPLKFVPDAYGQGGYKEQSNVPPTLKKGLFYGSFLFPNYI